MAYTIDYGEGNVREVSREEYIALTGNTSVDVASPGSGSAPGGNQNVSVPINNNSASGSVNYNQGGGSLTSQPPAQNQPVSTGPGDIPDTRPPTAVTKAEEEYATQKFGYNVSQIFKEVYGRLPTPDELKQVEGQTPSQLRGTLSESLWAYNKANNIDRTIGPLFGYSTPLNPKDYDKEVYDREAANARVVILNGGYGPDGYVASSYDSKTGAIIIDRPNGTADIYYPDGTKVLVPNTRDTDPWSVLGNYKGPTSGNYGVSDQAVDKFIYARNVTKDIGTQNEIAQANQPNKSGTTVRGQAATTGSGYQKPKVDTTALALANGVDPVRVSGLPANYLSYFGYGTGANGPFAPSRDLKTVVDSYYIAKRTYDDPAYAAQLKAENGWSQEDLDSWRLYLTDPEEWFRQAKKLEDQLGITVGGREFGFSSPAVSNVVSPSATTVTRQAATIGNGTNFSPTVVPLSQSVSPRFEVVNWPTATTGAGYNQSAIFVQVFGRAPTDQELQQVRNLDPDQLRSLLNQSLINAYRQSGGSAVEPSLVNQLIPSVQTQRAQQSTVELQRQRSQALLTLATGLVGADLVAGVGRDQTKNAIVVTETNGDTLIVFPDGLIRTVPAGQDTAAVINSYTGPVTGNYGFSDSQIAQALATNATDNSLAGLTIKDQNQAVGIVTPATAATAATAISNAVTSAQTVVGNQDPAAAAASAAAAATVPTVPEVQNAADGGDTPIQATQQNALEQNTKFQSTLQARYKEPASSDWRLRLQLAPAASYLYRAPDPGILQPLYDTDGVIFPYTPTIETSYNATYETYDLVHSNYRGYFYKGSRVNEIQVRGTFTAQDTQEATYMLAVIHFFRSVTKMFYGAKDQYRGAPPPLCYLSGFGEYQFNQHPVLVSNFVYSLPADVDYIRARIPNNYGTNMFTQRPRTGAIAPNPATAGLRRLLGTVTKPPVGAVVTPPIQGQMTANTNNTERATYVPTKIEVSITLLPTNIRSQVSKQFNMKEFASGTLIKGGFW